MIFPVKSQKGVLMNSNIQYSTDYNKFKFFDYNRKILDSHVTSLVASIKKDNRLHMQPIICTPDLKIIDGQHRFHACKQLKIPVVYIIADTSPEDIMIDTNTYVVRWRLEDFLNFYVSKGYNQYIKLKKCLDETGWKFSIINALMKGKSKELGIRFRTGKFIFDDRIPDFINSTLSFTDFLKSFLERDRKAIQNNRVIYVSLFNFYLSNRDKYDKLLDLLKNNVYDIPSFSNSKEFDKFFDILLKKKKSRKSHQQNEQD